MERIAVKFQRLQPGVKVPKYATAGAAGIDLCALLDKELVLKPGEIIKVPTGLAIELPGPNVVAIVCARSGLASRYGITLANAVGVIDSDYRGEIQIPLINLGSELYVIKNGERIAQMLFLPVYLADLVAVTELGATGRGTGGFGSTGA